ncbi:MAG TPA: FAD-dependent oxidoreductase [Solirubrobacteraceae bacterium]|jgi:uncharacterized protein with NAD-binding domain and iron-sulfur cluster|nr:FAD-dependent oxidoreductase [Solirubrobacteraceae bacterium]
MSEAPRVTVAGGGLAGLAAALRLAERGYRVTVYEQKSMLGGNLASRPAAHGVYLDVYPHMYCNWYHNFWRLLDDTSGVDRSTLFAPVSGYKQLCRGDFPRFTGVTDMYSPWHMLQNMFSGVGPPADMFVFGYATIDLLAERLNPTMLLKDMSVNGFLNARPYMTKRASAAYDSFITGVWAIPSYLASAHDFRLYLEYCLANPTPAFWLPRGSARDRVISHLADALKAAGVNVVTKVQLTSVSCAGGRVSEIGLQHTEFDKHTYAWVGVGEPWTEEVEETEEVILAVPPFALSKLVRSGGSGRRIVEAEPDIAELARLRAQPIPIVHLYFTRKLAHIPAEPVGLFGSRLRLAFTDISQTWEDVGDFAGRTVLAVSSSDVYGLPGTAPSDDAYAILVELAEYLGFDAGPAWGQSSDIDWERTRYDTNADTQLFVNETGTDVWRPRTVCESLSNLCFAGDFCHSHVGMTTIESAVTTGLEAARAIVERRGVGAPVEVVKPASDVSALSGALYVWLRYAWAPYALSASAWSRGSDHVRGMAPRASDAKSLLRYLLTPGRPPRRHR